MVVLEEDFQRYCGACDFSFAQGVLLKHGMPFMLRPDLNMDQRSKNI